VALFGEPGTTDHSRWPGKETMDAMLVARATLLTTQLDEPVISITAVATYSAESRTAIQLSKAIVEAKGGSAPPPDLMAVTFATENLAASWCQFSPGGFQRTSQHVLIR